jgi:hypothetical protein
VRARHQAGQEGWPSPDCAQRRGPGTVRLQAGAVGFVLLPGDVGWALFRDEGEPLARRHDDAPAPGPPGLVLARIVLPPPVDVGAGIQRVLEDLLERRPVRAAPDQLPLAWPLPDPDPDLDLVPRQVAQDAAERAQLGELLEDQADDRLDLLVRIERDLAVLPDVARRHRDA